MAGKRVGFVILTWNSQQVIERCLRSVLQLQSSLLKPSVVVVDNGSGDATVSVVENVFAAVDAAAAKLVRLSENKGTTVPRNIGIRQLQADGVDYICILDSDTEVNAAAMERLVQVLEEDPSCGIVGPRMHDSKGVYQRSGRQIPTLGEKLMKGMPFRRLQEKGTAQESVLPEDGTGCVDVGYLMSACWMMRASLFDTVGLLDEAIFYAPEDVELCIRCWKSGYAVLYCFDADILHEWQRLSRKKLFSKHNWEHIKGLAYLFGKHKFLFRTDTLLRRSEKE